MVSGVVALSACASGDSGPGPSADGGGSADAGPAVDTGTGEMDAGPTDGGFDAGPILQLCEECAIHPQCGEVARCAELTTGEHACLALCDPDIPSCPRGFECASLPGRGFTVCVPVGERCCIDEDADDYGVGIGCAGPDCDDGDIDRNPGLDELCNGVDDNCDGEVDNMPVDCPGRQCRATAAGAYEELEPTSCEEGECVEPGATPCGLYACSEGEDSGDRCATSCTDGSGDRDDLCVPGAHCDAGECFEDQPNGGECDEDTDCESAYCDNGFCCDDGECCNTGSDCSGFGTIGTTCDDSATCQGSRGEIICESFQCTTNSGIPDDSACDSSTEANTCGFFTSVYCSGGTNQPVPTCPSTCSADSECDANAHCDTVCLPDLPDGDVCNEDSDCISGHCNNNVCCASGDCCRNADDCPASYRTAPTCDSPTACQGTRDAATCTDFQCGTVMDVADDSACDSSVLASNCGLYPSRYCSGGTDQPSPVCADSCTGDSDCDASAHCDLNTCVPDLPSGQACDEASDCISGHCQNGYCCAAGDCCAEASDCPFGSYGEPSTCDSAATCQGQRRDPICNADSQCQLGGLVDDDSGCDGLLANSCGLYPAVFCTGNASQPSDQASLCDSSCTTNADCDSGAFCNSSGECQSSGMAGDACTGTGECAAGLSCVDGVCCTSSCTGTCRACNVAGSEGTCTNVPDGTDPAGECGSVSCGSYYAGWTGDRCYFRSDAPASAVSCNGSGACETSSDVCSAQPAGALQLDCDDLCQDPTPGTCSGTLAGACTNVTPSPSTQTCGTGACRVTANRCNSGTPVTCEPGDPSPETCNDVDDNCNGAVDDGLSGDIYEPNPSCSAYHNLGTIYTQAKSGEPASRTINATIYGSGDVDYYRVYYTENDSSCGCGFPWTDEDYGLQATLQVPAGAGSYRVCAKMGSCGEGSTCRTVAAGAMGSVTIWKDGACPGSDSGTGWFVIRGVGSPGYECLPYTLTVQTTQGCR